MPQMQNPYLPASGSGGVFDWSGEISGQPGSQDAPRQNGQITNIQVNQHQQNHAAPQGASPTQTVPLTQLIPPAGSVSGGQAGGTPMDQTGGQSQTGSPAGGMAAVLPAAPQGTIPTLRPQGGVPAVLDMRNHMTREQIEAPTTVDEAHMGSMKAVLGRNLGNFVVATFLVGTQGTTSWEGQLHEVGNDYLIIYQTGRDRYIVCDIYSLKYIEFYDTQRQELCENIMRNQGWQNNGWQENG